MSKKINLKSMSLDNLNLFLVACKDLENEMARYNEEKKPLQDAYDKKVGERTRLEKEGLSSEHISVVEESKALTICKEEHTLINKGINARINEVVKKYCPKDDEMYSHYASISGSDAFAKDVLAILTGLGAKVNDTKRGAKQIAHITGWRASKKDGCMKPVSRKSFITMIFLGISTMVQNEGLAVRNEDGSLTWTRELGGIGAETE